ncbi:MAG: ATP-dependent Clp protease adaptor ClpS [Chloroflexota bacterium]
MKTQVIPKIEIVEETKTTLEPLYRVIIHNDDVTPMGFVVHVLRAIFRLPPPDAVEVMMTAHLNGNALVQTLPRRDAESRIAKAHLAASLENYPLHFSMEPE